MNTLRKTLLLSFLLILVLLSVGCQPTPLAPVQEEPAATAPIMEADTPELTAVTETAPPVATEAPPATATEAITVEDEGMVAGTIGGIALTYPSALVEEVTVETIPAFEMAADDWVTRYFAHPAITRLHFAGFPVEREYSAAYIDLIPVEAATSLQLRAEQQVEQLQELLTAQLQPPLPDRELPFLPARNAAQLVHAAETYLSFQNGDGVRYLTVYAQDYVPISNQGLEYVFQGLTSDGQFYVSAVFPVTSMALPQDIAAAQEEGWDGMVYHLDSLAYDEYLGEQRALLDDLPAGQFTPSLAELDAMVQSLDLSAYSGPDVEPWAVEVLPAPEQVVDHFLERYTADGGFAKGAHRDDPALHAEYVAALDSMSERWTAQGVELSQYDPVLMSTVLPEPQGFNFESLHVWPGNVNDGTAQVRVDRRWLGMQTTLPLLYSLRWQETDGAWQIEGVSVILSHPARTISEAEQLVESVFAPGLGMLPGIAIPELESLELPSEVESHLCIQDCPWGFAIEGAFAAGEALENGATPLDVVVYTSFGNDVRVVRVEPRSDGYVVTDKTVAVTPAERARAFYAWYLAEAEQSAAAGESRWAPRVPRIAEMNEFPLFISERFLSDAYRRMTSEDPYLPSGEVPLWFHTEEGPQEDTAYVHLVFEEGEQTLLLTFVGEAGSPLIDNIEVIDG